MGKSLARKLMALNVVVFFVLTLGMFYQVHAPMNFVPFRTIGHDLEEGGPEFVVNLLGNIAAFLPMGWLLPSALGRRCSAGRVVALGLAVSLVAEVLQGVSGRRVADVDDLILNTTGGLLGFGLRLGFDRLRGLWPGGDQKA